MTRSSIAYPPPGIVGRMWHNLVADPTLTAAQRACLSAATRMADLTTRPGDSSDEASIGARRDQDWYRVAVGAYTQLNETGAYRLIDSGLPRSPKPCRADPARIRSWLATRLDGPSVTVAAGLGIDVDFDLDDPELMTVIESLVRRAQDAGVFGVPGYTIHAHPVADVDTCPDAHIITLASPTGFALATNPIPPDQLIGDRHTGIDAAVSVLVNTATAVDELRQHWTLIAVTANVASAPRTRRRPSITRPVGALGVAARPTPA